MKCVAIRFETNTNVHIDPEASHRSRFACFKFHKANISWHTHHDCNPRMLAFIEVTASQQHHLFTTIAIIAFLLIVSMWWDIVRDVMQCDVIMIRADGMGSMI